MEGLEVAEVNIKDIDLSDRIDAEFFNRTDLRMQSMLREKGALPLSTYCDFVASAFYPAATQLYDKGDTPFVRCVDCISHPVITKDQDDTFEKIPREFIECNDGICSLRRNDIVLTKVGTPCFASLIAEHDFIALSRTVMGLQDVHDIDPRYLMIFLRSKYGYSQLLRQRELTIQYQLTVDRVKRVLISRANEDVERKVCSLVDRYIESERRFRKAYLDAERMLLDELGFSVWRPSGEGVSIKSLSDTIAANRIDAEYFQPEFDEIYRKIHSCSTKIIRASDVLVEGLCKSEGDQEERYVELADIGFSGTIESCTRAKFVELPSRARQRILGGQVIVSSIEGSLKSCALVTDEYDGALCSTGFHRFQSDEINPETLLLLFKSWPIQEQLRRGCSGTILSGISSASLSDVVLPVLPQDSQIALAEKVRESFRFRQESKRLLTLAKFAVEKTIEDGEDRAIELIKNSIRDDGEI